MAGGSGGAGRWGGGGREEPSSRDQKAHQTHEGISSLMDERKKK